MSGYSATSTASVQEAKKRLRAMLKTLDAIPTEVLQEEAVTLKSEILVEIPYKTGKLERSVHVAVAKDKRRPGINASASAVSSHGYNYAGIQHETPGFHHSKASAKAYYIADPFKRSTKRIEKKIRKNLRRRRR